MILTAKIKLCPDYNAAINISKRAMLSTGLLSATLGTSSAL